MTDTGPPTTVGDVIVNGQTRRAPSPYATIQWPTKGTGTGDQQQQITDDPNAPIPEGFTEEQIACPSEEGRRQWDSDAMARAAVSALLAAAFARFSEDLQNREFGALICQAGDGTLMLGPIHDGPPILGEDGRQIIYYGPDGQPDSQPTVAINPDGCAGSIPVGFIHSHPGVNAGIPSPGDFAFARWLVENRSAPNSISIYTAASYLNPNTNQYLNQVTRANLSDESTAQSGTFVPRFVDPNATFCPTVP